MFSIGYQEILNLQSIIYTHSILLLCWLGFCIIHSFLALDRVKLRFKQLLNLSVKGYRIFYNLVAFFSLGLVIALHFYIESTHVFRPGFLARLFAVILMVCGLLIMAICIRKYFAEMSGLFQNTGDKLETTGIHRFVRHPLYLGTFLFIFSLTLLWPDVKNILVLAVITVYTRIGIFLEEKKLIGQFGDQYRKYKNSVPMLIPELFKYKK